MFRVYLTIYKPNIASGRPYMYIGSTAKAESDNYFGSVSSKEYKVFWKFVTKNNPTNFLVFTLSVHQTRQEALEEELNIQKELNVMKDENYFNKSMAAKNGMFGRSMVGSSNTMYGRSRKGEKVGGAVTPLYGEQNPCWRKNPLEGKSEEWVKEWKQRVARKGDQNGCYGSTFIWINKNGEHKRHDKNLPIPDSWSVGFLKTKDMQEKRKRKVKCINTGVVYSSMQEAAIATNSSGAKISLVCSGHRKKTNGLMWEYA